MNLEEMNAKIEALTKKYKLTVYGIIPFVAAYIYLMFAGKNNMILLALCVPMIILGLYNYRLGKQITALVNERAKELNRQKALEEREARIEAGEDVELSDVTANEAIVANCQSLNDLPKEYTVMDNIDVNGETIAHIIVSPYGVALVNETDPTEEVREIIDTLNIEPPIFYYEPSDDIALLAERIQMPKEVVLSEPEVYSILYRVSGLK
ncbi:MAG: hypothetical protein HUJ55_01245 [Ileibacterium sp.]|nr:hypothetical protein [Ileibacterium sp.]